MLHHRPRTDVFALKQSCKNCVTRASQACSTTCAAPLTAALFVHLQSTGVSGGTMCPWLQYCRPCHRVHCKWYDSAPATTKERSNGCEVHSHQRSTRKATKHRHGGLSMHRLMTNTTTRDAEGCKVPAPTAWQACSTNCQARQQLKKQLLQHQQRNPANRHTTHSPTDPHTHDSPTLALRHPLFVIHSQDPMIQTGCSMTH
jgi:hypothetical protein